MKEQNILIGTCLSDMFADRAIAHHGWLRRGCGALLALALLCLVVRQLALLAVDRRLELRIAQAKAAGMALTRDEAFQQLTNVEEAQVTAVAEVLVPLIQTNNRYVLNPGSRVDIFPALKAAQGAKPVDRLLGRPPMLPTDSYSGGRYYIRGNVYESVPSDLAGFLASEPYTLDRFLDRYEVDLWMRSLAACWAPIAYYGCRNNRNLRDFLQIDTSTDYMLLSLMKMNPEDVVRNTARLDSITGQLLDDRLLPIGWRSYLQWICILQVEQFSQHPRQIPETALERWSWPSASGLLGRMEEWAGLPGALRDYRSHIGLAVDLFRAFPGGMPGISATLEWPHAHTRWASPVLDAHLRVESDARIISNHFSSDLDAVIEIAITRYLGPQEIWRTTDEGRFGVLPDSPKWPEVADLVPRFLPDNPVLIARLEERLRELRHAQ
jgi:hypothetical protein